jgi:predicted RNA-binding protein with PUA-like domain
MHDRRCWLVKSEPEEFSIDDLQRDGRADWDGVRNYQARNYLREMRVGDPVLFYHSSVVPPGVAGSARVCRTAYPDRSALNPRSRYFDPRATEDDPIWLMVDLEFVERFARLVTLDELKRRAELRDMLVLKRGQRLSVLPVDMAHFRLVRALGHPRGESTP